MAGSFLIFDNRILTGKTYHKPARSGASYEGRIREGAGEQVAPYEE